MVRESVYLELRFVIRELIREAVKYARVLKEEAESGEVVLSADYHSDGIREMVRRVLGEFTVAYSLLDELEEEEREQVMETLFEVADATVMECLKESGIKLKLVV